MLRKRAPVTKPTPYLRAWMRRTATTDEALAEKIRNLGLRCSAGSIRQVADYRQPGHRLASALVVITGIPMTRLRPPVKFAKAA